ncbi:hypothetical protein GCM10022204_25840 [Microlunatus aurantiacus]|uniref:Uncharacterized protein n=1 Tax=Microlunatus aurantiacus TaxID=446786 RepID=A0ABP7DR02_9ACTN
MSTDLISHSAARQPNRAHLAEGGNRFPKTASSPTPKQGHNIRDWRLWDIAGAGADPDRECVRGNNTRVSRQCSAALPETVVS